MAKPVVHISDIQTFGKCRVKWAFSSPWRLNLQPKKPNKHLFLGSGVHEALRAYYSTDRSRESLVNTWNSWISESQERMQERIFDVPSYITEYISLGDAMLDHYAVWAPLHDRINVIIPEVHFNVDMGDYVLAGTIDLLAEDLDLGENVMWEHKTYSKFPAAVGLQKAWQTNSYLLASHKGAEFAEGVGPIKTMVYNILRKYPPTEPTVLKSGGLSMRKDIVCSPEYYMHLVRERGLDESEYKDFVAGLDPFKLNQRVRITRTDRALEVFEERLNLVVHEMLNTTKYVPTGDTIRECPYCDYATMCDLWYDGDPAWKIFQETDFEVRDDRDEGYEDY